MPADQTIADMKLRFRPRGVGRFAGAAFLSLWLCGWAAGETFALFMLGHGIYSLITGRPALGSDQPLQLGPALAVGCFLAVWLTIWTLGGVMAIRELLRSLWAEDRLILDRDALTRVHRLGPFVFTRRLARSEIRRVFVQQHGSRPLTLMAQLGTGVIELTALGTQTERDEAAQQLRTVLGLAEESPATWPAALPEQWQVITESRGDIRLVPNLKTRRKQALIVSAIAIIVWSAAALLTRESLRDPKLWAVTAMVGAAAVWLGWQAIWLHRGRKEWRIEHGKLILQRRFGLEVTELTEARALELTESSDSDGDRWYELRAVELSPSAFAPARKIPRSLKIDRSIHDPTAPRCVGRWLSQRADIPFHDRVPTETDRQAERVKLREALAASGKFGRWVARFIEKAAPERRSN